MFEKSLTIDLVLGWKLNKFKKNHQCTHFKRALPSNDNHDDEDLYSDEAVKVAWASVINFHAVCCSIRRCGRTVDVVEKDLWEEREKLTMNESVFLEIHEGGEKKWYMHDE